MKLIVGLFLLAIICVSTACNNAGTPATNTANANTNAANSTANTNAAANTAAASKDVLAAREKQAFDALKSKDGKFFDGFLISNFVETFGPYRASRAGTVKMISENPCTVANYSMADEKVTTVSPQVAVITMKVTADVTCEGKKMPSPVTSVSIYVREGNEWKGAYHTEVPIASADSKPGPPPPPAPASAAPQPNAALAATLIEREKFIWDAWKEHDASKVEGFLTNDASAVEMNGAILATKADIVKSWTTPCEVKDIKITNEHAVEISPGVALFLYKGTANGKCGDMPVLPQWATTVYVKEGDIWKGAYFVASPA
ncbi:MAG TPA: nuclear transport factor 2 family protein [Pyrinomonadaceae bacterium]|nr:nuclear transport factor 2 family protein [Pyrinomonadaceae bacterium]